MVRRLVGLIVNYKFHFLVFALAFFMMAHFYVDADLGWHIAIGRAFVAGEGIIRFDRFSWTMEGHYWGNSYFLYQVLVAWIFGKLGYLAAVFIFGTLAAISVVLLLPKKLNFVAVLVAVLGVLIASVNLGLRPHVFDFLFFALLLVFLERKFYENKAFLPFWFLFFALWANFHVGFLVGLLVFSGFLVVDRVERRARGDKVAYKFTALVLAAAWFGTLATPFHFDLWKSIILDSTSPMSWLYVVELQPVILSFSYMTFYILSGVIFIRILRQHSKVGVHWLLAAAALFMLPFVSYFYTLFWAVMFIFLGTRYLKFDHVVWAKFHLGSPIYVSFAVLALASAVGFWGKFDGFGSLEAGFVKYKYPVAAMNYIESRALGLRLYNNYNWGGFIDWQYPKTKVFIDGRMTGWRKTDGEYIFHDYVAIESGDCELVKHWGIETALVSRESKARCFLDWNLVYEDEISKVLVKPNE